MKTRIQLIIIAASLAIMSTFLGLTAFLTDDDTFTAHFNTDDMFGIIVTTEEFSDGQDVIPGEEITFDPAVANTGKKSAYVFLEVSVPVDGGNDPIFSYSPASSWVQVGDESISGGMVKRVYGYGSAGNMTAVEAGATTDALFTSVAMKEMSTEEYQTLEKTDIVIKGYAIQTIGIQNATPAAVWADLV